MVETHSAICSMDYLNYDLDTSLLDKGATDAQFRTIDQHPSAALVSPRISSTPPSTPGLESNQEKETKDDEDDDEDDDYADYTDYAYDEYINGDYSEADEDYFFKDFAANTKNNDSNKDSTATTTDRPKSKRYSRRRRSQKAMSRFDLQSFARQLHANRLSVLQTRQSRMILTEEDEQELDKLLARKITQPPPIPTPVPALPSSVPASVPLTTSTPLDTATTISGSKATVIEPSSTTGLAGPTPFGSLSSDSLKNSSVLLQKLNDQQRPSIRSKNTTFIEMAAPLSPSLSDPSSFTSPRRAPTPPSETSSPFSLSASLSSSSTSTSTTEKDRKVTSHVPTAVTLGPAPTSFALKKKSSWITNRKHKARDQPKLVTAPLSPLSPTATTPLHPSISLDSLEDSPQSTEIWKLTKASTTKPAVASSTTKAPEVSSVAPPVLDENNNKKPKSRLFGSLRQASRSSRAAGEGAIRGLMRNLSTVGNRQQQRQQGDQSTDNSTMSRAAIAAIQHNVSSNNKTSPTNKKSKTVSASALPHSLDLTEGMDDTTVQVTHTATSTKGGVRLLTNLLAKARSRRSSPAIKRTTEAPLNDTDSTAIKERNKVVRRTIIYVQPDALDFMKDGHMPPMPAPRQLETCLSNDNDNGNQARLSNDTTMEDATSPTVEYATATKLTRQTSRRKRLVEESPGEQQQQAQHPHASTATTDHKKWRLESVSEFNIAESTAKNDHQETNNDDADDNDDNDLYDYYHTSDNSRLEGLELREMSDGSVVWGIVKKQGNRKSFFASKALEDGMMAIEQQQVEIQQEMEKEHDRIEKSVLALMGLEPDSLDHFTARRSNTSSSSGSGKSRTSAGSVNDNMASLPPPIPKRSPRRKHGSGNIQHMQQQDDRMADDSTRVQRGLSVEEQLDEMMLSLKQSQF